MKPTERYDVFISYRSSDGASDARLIRDYLQQYDLKVFVDFEVLATESGGFEENIQTALMNSKDFLLLITPDIFNEEKINDPYDWVAKEIKCALNYRLNFIPILTRPDMKLPNKNVLPIEIQDFLKYPVERISCCVSDKVFKAHLEQIIRKLRSKTPTTVQVKKGALVEIDGTERKRLDTQAKITSEFLQEICDNCAEQLVKEGRSSLKVLDVGCANGELGRLCFQDKVYSKVYGIDINEESIREARKHSHNNDKYTYEKFDVELVGKTPEKLFEVLNEQIKFDIIFCSMVLHHIKNDDLKHDENYVQVIEILQNFKDMIAPSGYLIVNNPDDSSKLAYKDDGELKEKQVTTDDTPNTIKSTLDKLVQLTSRIPGVSDRYCGRATYYWLARAGFKDITIKCAMQNTSNMTRGKKIELFEQLFGWQQGQIDRSANAGLIETPEEKNKLKTELEVLTSALKFKLTSQNDFWLCSCDYIGIAKNEQGDC
jgi:2-polyprenyl-3-methyl-5-hydroxy-6-metoxy-1,4-benzoquinol methylase